MRSKLKTLCFDFAQFLV